MVKIFDACYTPEVLFSPRFSGQKGGCVLYTSAFYTHVFTVIWFFFFVLQVKTIKSSIYEEVHNDISFEQRVPSTFQTNKTQDIAVSGVIVAGKQISRESKQFPQP